MTQRLFLAIPLPADIKSELNKQKDSLHLSLKWIPESNLHVTIHFFGDTEADELNNIIPLIRKITNTTLPFSLEISSLLIKSGKFQHMIWAGFKESPSFETLATGIAKSLGIENFRKPLPHINLVRSKEKIRSRDLPLILPPMALAVDHIELWESKLSSEGSTYFLLESFTLGGRKTSP